MNKTMKKTVKTFAALAAAVTMAAPALADNAALPVAQVEQLTPEQLAAWNAVGVPITDFYRAFEAHTTGRAWTYNPMICTNKADVGYVFRANKEESSTPYDGWYVDYVVSFDKDVAKDSMGLVGMYKSWGSLGFLSPVNVPAGYKVPLLNSVMLVSNWTYKQIRDEVGEFTCGAFNLSPTNEGTVMNVELRLFKNTLKPEQICNVQLWEEGVNTHLICTNTWTIGKAGTLPAVAGRGPLQVAGTADAVIPAGYYYLDSENDTRKFVKASSDHSVVTYHGVSQPTAYFTERPTVCKIGEVAYEKLEDAFAAAEDGDTIVLTQGNSEVFTADTAKLFDINTNGCAFVSSNITPKEGCDLVLNLDGTYTYRMKVVVKDLITKNVVETKVEDEIDTAAVAITDDNFKQLFPAEGAKTLEIIASGVGTVSFDPDAVTKIGQNITNIITQAGGYEYGATAKTTVTVAIADVTEETPKLETLEVVQAVSVTAILRTIVRQASSETAVTNEEVYAAGKCAGISTVTIPYSGIKPQVWFVADGGTATPMTTTYDSANKLLSFEVEHFSEYVITDESIYAIVGTEKFRTLQEAFDWVETNQTQGTTVTLTKNNSLAAAATFNGEQATLDLNGKTISWTNDAAKASGLIANNGKLKISGGDMNAGADVLMTCGNGAETYITGGLYTGTFPQAGTVTNAGPILISGGVFSNPIPPAFCAKGYLPGDEYDATVGGYRVRDAEIYIRDIGACQRYPWNGYVDIDFDVCWGTNGTAKLYVTAWDKMTGEQITMTKATLVEDGVQREGQVDCSTGFVVTTQTSPVAKKHLHLIWNSTEGVPMGQKKDRVGFKFVAK